MGEKKIHRVAALTLCVTVFLSGCESTAQSFKEALGNASEAFNRELEKSQSSTANSTRADAEGLRQAGIVDIFVNAPFDESKKSDHQWPRVAIEVLSSPS